MKQTEKHVERKQNKHRAYLERLAMKAEHACNQCGHKMKYILVKNQIFVCRNAYCPNYGALQVCAQDMDDIKKTKS